MFDKDELSRAIDLQKRSYELLQWVASAVKRGFISFKAAHTYSSASSAASDWVQRHYQNIPENARPSVSDLKDFSGLFSTYLENSFELVSSPGKQLYSPDAHCFCPMCSWLVDAPNLKTKSPTPKDKKRAQKMVSDVIKRIAAENQVRLPEEKVEVIANDPSLRDELALCAYGSDLFQRMNGIAVGTAALVLWRSFAWLSSGSPKKKFELTAELILEAEETIRQRVLSIAN
ncbi:MAG: hypothetical protein K1X72_23330 [Pyrinomonadaceae bacterium]|nr:hypothetical protein [Pyrinomonadaceae bacterium]